MKTYKISSFKDYIENYDTVVRITDFENFFNVYDDKKRDAKTFNLNASMYFNIDTSKLPTYTIAHSAFWPQLSYMIYSTPRLSWLLMKLNDVKADDMFSIVPTGSKVKFLSTDIMQQIVQMLNEK